MNDVLAEELASFRTATGKEPLDILEIGVARSTSEDHLVGDGWSTVTLARDVQQHGGSLTGIDLDTSAASELLVSRGLRAELIRGDSLVVLPVLQKQGRVFDVVFLDGANDAGVVMEEFLIVQSMVRSPGLILADDMDQDDPEVVKGLKLIPHLKEKGVPFRLTHRETPWTNREILVLPVL
jgi:predicted O-methyltransferase YrrM